MNAKRLAGNRELTRLIHSSRMEEAARARLPREIGLIQNRGGVVPGRYPRRFTLASEASEEGGGLFLREDHALRSWRINPSRNTPKLIVLEGWRKRGLWTQEAWLELNVKSTTEGGFPEKIEADTIEDARLFLGTPYIRGTRWLSIYLGGRSIPLEVAAIQQPDYQLSESEIPPGRLARGLMGPGY